MQFDRPSLTQHRLRRLVLWTLAMLSWIVAILFGSRLGGSTLRHVKQRIGFISLPWLTDLAALLLLARAAHFARRRRCGPVRYWRRGRDLRRAHLIRSALGARLRRAMKHKDTGIWLANIIGVLRNLDAYAVPLARRLRRGLTRFWSSEAPIAPDIAFAESPASLVRPRLGGGGSPGLADSS